MNQLWHTFKTTAGDIAELVRQSLVIILALWVISGSNASLAADHTVSASARVGITKVATFRVKPVAPITLLNADVLTGNQPSTLCLEQLGNAQPYVLTIDDNHDRKLRNTDSAESIAYQAKVIQGSLGRSISDCGHNASVLNLQINEVTANKAMPGFYQDSLIVTISPV